MKNYANSRHPFWRRPANWMLLTTVLVSIVISALIVQQLATQDEVLAQTLTSADSQVLALVNRDIESDLQDTLQNSFFLLKNLPNEQLTFFVDSTPFLKHVLLLDRSLRPVLSWPRTSDADALLALWQQKYVNNSLLNQNAFGTPRILLENSTSTPLLLAFQAPSPFNENEGGMLITYDLPLLLEEIATPHLQSFQQQYGGRFSLIGPHNLNDRAGLFAGLGTLPDWGISYLPQQTLLQESNHRRQLILAGLGTVAVLVLLLTAFISWRELNNERQLAQLRNRFVANVSHELKTPLALIKLYAETLLLQRVQDPSKQQQYHQTILDEAERLSTMINRVLDLEKLRNQQVTYQLKEHDLRSSVQQILREYQDMMSAQTVQLHTQLADDLPKVWHDPNGIKQILLNLLSNAYEHGKHQQKLQLTVALTTHPSTVELSVTDDGPGLSDSELQALRLALQRGEAAPSKRGSGLGLALVEHVALAHQGSLQLAPAPHGTGLRVSVFFPLAAVKETS